ncbi:Ala-tRNA(Pro) hydrolase [Albidovulum inexpectatum]|uniref:Alanine--tRNA ligase n=1 Tax=Albidovulum inexpectatum TaxID=196587 RepID=A0A2S5JIH6_9RHOB|nr:alanyl-tRNA editing protein [Albidovulum inexpectatum]PPB81346.1 Ala-tRNA(Pro) hydrolase [Albidovulum inexpectatum]
MSEPLYRARPYLRRAVARVAGVTEDGGIVVDEPLFYPTGGGQPGDRGELVWNRGRVRIVNTVKGEGGASVMVAEDGAELPFVGEEVEQILDWEMRYLHMRVHTALHLLSVVIPLPVTGGQIGAGKGRLDFDMPEPPADIAALEEELNTLIARDLPVTEDWITDEELAANPALVKTMSVKPPMGQGRVRLIRIGQGTDQVDLQPCGGTHVARTGEIGRIRLGKVEKKGRQNRRASLHLVDGPQP